MVLLFIFIGRYPGGTEFQLTGTYQAVKKFFQHCSRPLSDDVVLLPARTGRNPVDAKFQFTYADQPTEEFLYVHAVSLLSFFVIL